MANTQQKIEKPAWENFELEFYKECGHLYRHFSTIRVAVMTAGLGSVLTMAAYVLINTTRREALVLWMIIVIVMYLFVLSIAAIFTVKANQAKDYMVKMEDKGKDIRNMIVIGPFTKVASQFKPVGKIFDAVTGSFFVVSLILAIAFVYRIVTM